MFRVLAIVCALTGLAAADDTCPAGRTHCIGIALHVVPDAVTPEWIAAELAAANRHFAPLDVGFTAATSDALPATAAHLVTRKDRDAIAAHRLGGTTIHVFVVAQLDDVDEPGQIAYGVTWHAHGTYLIVSAQALERTLAHELGHFFGLPHSDYAISIMNKSDRQEPPMDERTFAPEELDAMRPTLRRMLRDKVITDVR